MNSIRVRPGAQTDAESLTELSRQTFIDTYAIHNTPEDMALYLRQSLTVEQWRDILSHPDHVVLLLEDGIGLAGYAELRTGFVPDCVTATAPIELSRLYILTDRFGQGLGARLMESAVAEAARRGRSALWLGVWQKNERAIGFYRKSGFKIVGNQVFPLGRDLQADWVMMKTLGG
ncbi:MAG: GNAT family N-acetyltransferase [Gemmatimonadota bacterium]